MAYTQGAYFRHQRNLDAETALYAANSVASCVASQIASDVGSQIAMDVAQHTASHVSDQVANHVANHVAQEVASHVANQIAMNQSAACQAATEVFSTSVATQVATNVATHVATQVAADTANKVADQVTQLNYEIQNRAFNEIISYHDSNMTAFRMYVQEQMKTVNQVREEFSNNKTISLGASNWDFASNTAVFTYLSLDANVTKTLVMLQEVLNSKKKMTE